MGVGPEAVLVWEWDQRGSVSTGVGPVLVWEWDGRDLGRISIWKHGSVTCVSVTCTLKEFLSLLQVVGGSVFVS